MTMTQTTATFGSYLKFLRVRAGLSQRDLALAVGYSVAQISRLEQTQRFPDPTVLTARFVPALGLEDEEALHLLRLAAQARLTEEKGGHAHVKAPLGNLPTPLTPLWGRDAVIAAIAPRLTTGNTRLLTLIGPPGIGKTRLGLAIAQQLAAQFRDGAWWVACATLRDPTQLPIAIMEALGLALPKQGAPLAALQAAVRHKQVLLLLDNVEHITAAGPLLTALLQHAPGVVALVTSRRRLQVYGEALVPVPPLLAPAPAAALAVIAAAPAVQLWVSRVQAVQPAWALTAQNAALVATLCARLDGLPLALELAAVRAHLVAPAQMLAQLDLRLVSGGPRDVPLRQRTLHAAIAWSYDALDPEVQRVFQQLAVFVGGAPVAAVAVVCAAERDPHNALNMLADNSLITLVPGDEPRWTMLETLRRFALAQLTRSGELAAVEGRHAAWCGGVAAAGHLALRHGDYAEGNRHFATEAASIEAALRWAIAQGDQTELGLQLVGDLRLYWSMRGAWPAAYAIATAVLQHGPAAPTLQRGRALLTTGGVAPSDVATAYLEEALALFRTLDAPVFITGALHWLGDHYRHQSRYAEAAACFAEALQLHEAHGDAPGQVTALRGLGNLAALQERPDEARPLLERSIALAREQHNSINVMLGLNMLTGVAFAEDDVDAAEQGCRESLAIARESAHMVAWFHAAQHLARVMLHRGAPAAAHALLRESMTAAHAVGEARYLAYALVGWADYAAALGDAAQAVRCHAAVAAWCAAHHAPLSPADQRRCAAAIAAARQTLGPAAFAAAWDAGSVITVEAAVAALGDA